ncbi:MAG: zinc protease [Thermomicrobiales bacterium]|nr:zinc protease [Thermomicrobiales bacterium]
MSDRSPVLERTLPNGLKLLLREAHDAPIASFWVWYRVGARNELPGLTGISHWVEHMQFKGTPTLAKGAIFREVSRNGGVLNALTSNDWTAYYETLPSHRLDLALQIESDRMINSLFDPEETESERTVILSERQGAENNPTYQLYEEVVGTAFRAHPYRHMVIGYEEDLKRISRDDLYDHYRRAYRPNNAFISAVGDFDAEELASQIERSFGKIEPGPSMPPVRAVEPPQRDERRTVLLRPSPTAYLRMGFRTPAGRDPDSVPLLVADAVLSGGKAMGLGGGGPMGRSARLYRSLVAAGLARSAGSDIDMYIDPYLLLIGVTALPGVDPTRIEQVIDGELTRLATELVPDDELARALKQVKAQYIYSAEGVTNQAFWLGQMEIVDSYLRADTLVDEIEQVTAEDVRRVASTYLCPENRTVGWLLPSGAGGGAPDDVAEEMAAVIPVKWWGLGGPGQSSIEGSASSERAPFERAELTNGVVVLGQVQAGDPAASIRIRLEAGAMLDPITQPGLAAFTARTLTRGTPMVSFEEFNETTDRLGATVSIDAGRNFVEVQVRCLQEDVPALLDLVAEVLRRPTFPEEEVEKVRQELITSVKEQDNDTRTTADRLLRQLIYPEGHPYRHRTLGEVESLASVTRDDLAAFHRRHYGPFVMVIAAVGGIESFSEFVEEVDRRFADWTAEATPPGLPAPPTELVGLSDTAKIAGKSQADLAIGALTVPRTSPDYYPLEMGNLILGRLGLMGRLGANVRDKQGLAYYAYSAIESGRQASLWAARAGVDPANVDRAHAGVIAELRRLREEPVTEDELADGKSYLTGSLPIALETNDGVAATLLAIEYYDLGLDYLDRYPDIINAITREEVLAATRNHLDPDRLAVGIALPD